MQPPFWVNGQLLIMPGPDMGEPHRQLAAQHDLSGFLNVNATKDVAVSLTKVAGRHAEGRVLQQSQQQVAEPEQRRDVRA